jgi:hypothetical protein
MFKRSIMVFIMLAACFCAAYAAVSVEAKADVDRTEMTLGDVMTYVVTVERRGDVSQSPRIAPPDFAGFKVAGSYSSSSINIINSQSSITTTLRFDLLAVKSGQVEIKPASVTFMSPETKKYETVQTKGFTITVHTGKKLPPAAPVATAPPVLPVLPTAVAVVPTVYSGNLKEIKMNLDFRGWELVPYLLILIAVFVILAILWNFIFKKKKKVVVKKEVQDFRKLALGRLDAAREKMKSGQIKEFYIDSYEALRDYVSGSHNESFKELTTQEILRKLDDLKADKKWILALKELMQECDLVKFADYKPDINEAEGLYERARRLISGE